MNDGKDYLKRLRESLTGKKLKKDQLLILLLVGILLLVIALPAEEKQEEQEAASLSGGEDEEALSEEEYAQSLERRLEYLLSRMDGVGEASVMITLASSAEKVVEKDTEEDSETVTEADSQGGTRTTQNTQRRDTSIYDGDGTDGQSPYVSKELVPQVEGVVVIAEGGDDAVTVKNITESVQALFGIDTHKIRIVKGRREE